MSFARWRIIASMLPTNQRPHRLTLIGLGLLGFGLSVYLLIVHLAERGLACTVGRSCPLLHDHEYAQVAGIPLPVIGLVAFALVICAAIFDNDRARLIGMMVPLAGAFVIGWLTYVEVAEVGSVSFATIAIVALLGATLAATIWREVSVNREVARDKAEVASAEGSEPDADADSAGD